MVSKEEGGAVIEEESSVRHGPLTKYVISEHKEDKERVSGQDVSRLSDP